MEEQFWLKCLKRTGCNGAFTDKPVDVTLKVEVFGFRASFVFDGDGTVWGGKVVGMDDTPALEKFEVFKQHVQEVMDNMPGCTVEDLKFHESVFRDETGTSHSPFVSMTVKLHGHVMQCNMSTVRNAFERVRMNRDLVALGHRPFDTFPKLTLGE